jgi:hypothetical protein
MRIDFGPRRRRYGSGPLSPSGGAKPRPDLRRDGTKILEPPSRTVTFRPLYEELDGRRRESGRVQVTDGIDAEADPATRAVLVGILRETHD